MEVGKVSHLRPEEEGQDWRELRWKRVGSPGDLLLGGEVGARSVGPQRDHLPESLGSAG